MFSLSEAGNELYVNLLFYICTKLFHLNKFLHFAGVAVITIGLQFIRIWTTCKSTEMSKKICKRRVCFSDVYYWRNILYDKHELKNSAQTEATLYCISPREHRRSIQFSNTCCNELLSQTVHWMYIIQVNKMCWKVCFRVVISSA